MCGNHLKSGKYAFHGQTKEAQSTEFIQKKAKS